MSSVYGLDLSAAPSAADSAFGAAIRGLAAHQPCTGEALAATLSADADHVAALALKGFAALILARSELKDGASAALGEARRALALRDGGTADERILVEALAHAVEGRFSAAADRLDAGFADRPTVLLPFKVAHALRFMLGDAAGMLAASDRMVRDWTPDVPGAGFLLGCHAFALEEHGIYAGAESFGRRAVALEPEDAWGLHAVSHVHEMRGDTAEGIAWLEASRGRWTRCNNFAFHMAWHLALLHLSKGDSDRALDLYDTDIRPTQTDDFRDVANAVSLLWRLEHMGVDVGHRWADLREVAARRATDTSLVFASLHTIAALSALGDRAGVEEGLAALERLADGTGDQAAVARSVGLPLARVIAGKCPGVALDALAKAAPRLGGSNAQRDVFVLALADAAARAGDDVALIRIRAARRRLKADDDLIRAVDRRAKALPRIA